MKKHLPALSILVALALGAPRGMAQQAPPAPAVAGAQTFEVRPSGISRVVFTSDAPLETIDGVSSQTTGSFTVDPTQPGRALTGSVTIATASLRTGNDLRDEHLRGADWLDAAHHPDITFQLLSTTVAAPLVPGRPATGRVRGRLTLHGVTREITVPVTLRLVPLGAEHAPLQRFGINADMLRVQSEFRVQLSDYNVSIFAPLRLKVSNEIRLRVDLTAFRRAS